MKGPKEMGSPSEGLRHRPEETGLPEEAKAGDSNASEGQERAAKEVDDELGGMTEEEL